MHRGSIACRHIVSVLQCTAVHKPLGIIQLEVIGPDMKRGVLGGRHTHTDHHHFLSPAALASLSHCLMARLRAIV